MKRRHALVVGLATVLMATAANAAPQDRDEPVQAPRSQEVQAPREQEQQAPRGQDQTEAPREQEQQAPRGGDRPSNNA